MTKIEFLKCLTNKLLSGRFFLTVVVGIILLKTCLSNPELVKEYKEVLLVVIYAYFQRTDRTTEKGEKNEEVSKPSGS